MPITVTSGPKAKAASKTHAKTTAKQAEAKTQADKAGKAHGSKVANDEFVQKGKRTDALHGASATPVDPLLLAGRAAIKAYFQDVLFNPKTKAGRDFKETALYGMDAAGVKAELARCLKAAEAWDPIANANRDKVFTPSTGEWAAWREGKAVMLMGHVNEIGIEVRCENGKVPQVASLLRPENFVAAGRAALHEGVEELMKRDDFQRNIVWGKTAAERRACLKELRAEFLKAADGWDPMNHIAKDPDCDLRENDEWVVEMRGNSFLFTGGLNGLHCEVTMTVGKKPEVYIEVD